MRSVLDRPPARLLSIVLTAACGAGLTGVEASAAAPPTVAAVDASLVATPVAQAMTPITSRSLQDRGPDGLTKGKCIDDAAFAKAGDYASRRPGVVSLAVFEHGTVRSRGGGIPFRSASVVKAMVLAADLRRHARLGAPLTKADRARLASMIRVSDNGAATRTFGLVGRGEVLRVARLVGMRGYSVGNWWGTSQVTASDQARFFGRLHTAVPKPYRAFARRLLRTVVRKQTWGGARVARRHGYRTLFKSGWLPRSDGWVVHQGLRLERGGCSVGVAVLTGQQPNMSAGVESIRGVVERLM